MSQKKIFIPAICIPEERPQNSTYEIARRKQPYNPLGTNYGRFDAENERAKPDKPLTLGGSNQHTKRGEYVQITDADRDAIIKGRHARKIKIAALAEACNVPNSWLVHFLHDYRYNTVQKDKFERLKAFFGIA